MPRHLWIRHRNGDPILGFRFGKARPLFSERYEGTLGIPRRHFYMFGKRLTIIMPRVPANPRQETDR